IENPSPSRIAKAMLPSFPFGAISVKSRDIGVPHRDTNCVKINEWIPSAGIWNAKIRQWLIYFDVSLQRVLSRKRLLRKEMLHSPLPLCRGGRRTLLVRL